MEISQLEQLGDRKELVLDGVREYTEGYPVELWRNLQTGRLIIKAFNEGHNNCTEIDLIDLIDCLRLHGHITPTPA